MSAKKLTYNQALEEINQVIEEIESGKVDIDQLSEKLKKAKKMFDYCKNKLKDTQSEIDNMLEEETD
ncbi:MAG: exodeoxyribonuclease VII small subunit [Bacteroidales bacterium]|nr:exodeoxyribonuclease VII small subunit [Bacteroidales bacterium]